MKYINFENIKKLKNKKIKIIIATGLILTMGLTGCVPFKDNNQRDVDTGMYEEQQISQYPIEIVFQNWDQEIREKETVYFTDDTGAMYKAIAMDDDGNLTTYLISSKGEIISDYLKKGITISDLDETKKVTVKIDYKEKTITYDVEKIQKTK